MSKWDSNINSAGQKLQISSQVAEDAGSQSFNWLHLQPVSLLKKFKQERDYIHHSKGVSSGDDFTSYPSLHPCESTALNAPVNCAHHNTLCATASGYLSMHTNTSSWYSSSKDTINRFIVTNVWNAFGSSNSSLPLWPWTYPQLHVLHAGQVHVFLPLPLQATPSDPMYFMQLMPTLVDLPVPFFVLLSVWQKCAQLCK